MTSSGAGRWARKAKNWCSPAMSMPGNLERSVKIMAKKEFSCGRKIADPDTLETMSHEECKHILAQLSKGIAHPARIQIINILAHKPACDRCICGDIVNALPLAQSSVSQHLKVLKETGWIHGEIHGPSVCYCLVEGIISYYRGLLHKSIDTAQTQIYNSDCVCSCRNTRGLTSDDRCEDLKGEK